MGIRERNKKIYREKILTAAREVFSQQGYDETTIEQIAERAGVGLGTAYNYFKSKEELFILSIEEDVVEQTEYELNELDDEEQDVVKIVVDTLFRSIGRMKHIPKRIWKVVFPIVWNALKSDRVSIEEYMHADFKLMEQMGNLLERLKERHLLSDSFDVETAVDLIFGSLFLQMTCYIYMKDMTFDLAREKIETDIRFIFAGHTVKN